VKMSMAEGFSETATDAESAGIKYCPGVG